MKSVLIIFLFGQVLTSCSSNKKLARMTAVPISFFMSDDHRYQAIALMEIV